jgi:predicted dehydrogenase
MRTLVIGCGSIGKRHIRNLLALNKFEIDACEVDARKRSDIEKEFSIKVHESLEQALDASRYDAAFICTPPSFHVKQALFLVKKGLHCFIEKPLSHNLDGIDDLIAAAAAGKKTVMIGYTLRFSPYLARIKDFIDSGTLGRLLCLKASVGYYLPYWRPHEDYRNGYGSKKSLGGGIILDASHEIDYARFLIGEISEIFAVCRKLSSLDIDTEDFAEIIMRSESGAYAQIHLDYLQSNYRRSCEIIGEKGMLVWDINERTLRQYSLKDKSYHTYYEGLNANVNDQYLNETRHFFACIEGKEKPLIDLSEGKRLQEIFEVIRKSSESGSIVKL